VPRSGTVALLLARGVRVAGLPALAAPIAIA